MIYDYVFVTHLPAFYKVNLYNAIATQCKIYVIFVAQTSQIRTPDFVAHESTFKFDYCFLNTSCFEQRSSGYSLLQAFKILQKLSYRKLVVGGWDLIEFWLMIGLSPTKKNTLALESSCFESRAQGFKALLKKIFLSKINFVFCSGQPQQQLLQHLNFKGQSCKTLGVGIFHHQSRRPKKASFSGKFLYVGRLAEEKNLYLLVKAFQNLPHFTLTLIGQGPLGPQLASTLAPNIKMVGHVPNQELGAWYQQHDVFILPSKAEPWGLVVEEALYFGLPVIVSSQVGCAWDLVTAHKVGVVFEPNDVMSLQDAIQSCAQRFEQLYQQVNLLNFAERDLQQVQQYHQAILA